MNFFHLLVLMIPGFLPAAAHPCLKDSVSYPEDLHIVHTPEKYRLMVLGHSEGRLMALNRLIPGIHLDLRYAGTNNFMHRPIYTAAMAFMTMAAAIQLKEVELELNRKGLGLIIFDAYRPYTATLKIFSIVKDSDYAASGKTGSRHNRACAIDLSLVDLSTGKTLEMPTDYDSFSLMAHSDYPGASAEALKNRALLNDIMSRHGFTELKTEWWHFDFNGWRQFPLLDIPFESL